VRALCDLPWPWAILAIAAGVVVGVVAAYVALLLVVEVPLAIRAWFRRRGDRREGRQ
jgi:hypothetical protein